MSQETKTTTKETKSVNGPRSFVFGKENYILMLAGIVVLTIGFALMAGPADGDIFEARRITVAPIIVIAGFVIEIFAIFKKPKNTN
jgi:hypothetical protein